MPFLSALVTHKFRNNQADTYHQQNNSKPEGRVTERRVDRREHDACQQKENSNNYKIDLRRYFQGAHPERMEGPTFR